MNDSEKSILRRFGNRKAEIDSNGASDLKFSHGRRVRLYFEVGRFITETVNYSKQTINSKMTVKEFVCAVSDFLKMSFPGIKGFSVKNIMRMVRFYEFCQRNGKRAKKFCMKLPWSQILVVISMRLSDSGRLDYLKFCLDTGYSKRKLIRQIRQDFLNGMILKNGEYEYSGKYGYPEKNGSGNESDEYDDGLKYETKKIDTGNRQNNAGMKRTFFESDSGFPEDFI